MNTLFHHHAWRPLLASSVGALFRALAAGLLLAQAPAFAAPGAHGPNGEHLDAPTGMRAASALPRVEAKSESFEVVAELRAGELAILVDRYETNEPVLGAKLEVESGTLKAAAAFRAEQGDYAVTDAALLKLLATPGEHGLVFTLVAGKEGDLLDATFVSGAGRTAAAATQVGHGHSHAGDDPGHDHTWERAAWTAATIAALGLIGAIAWWRQRGREARLPRGAL